MNDKGRADGVLYHDENGQIHRQKAAIVVLACNGSIVSSGGDVWRRAEWHQMATARMGSNPDRSVVDSWGRCHDVKNPFIVDGSIFATSAAVNPTSTIQALALYVGNCIKKNRRRLFD